MTRWWRRLGALLALCLGALVLGPAGTAAAHPLGNFTVNHYAGLRLHADRVELFAVVDYAEIPTLQQRPAVDRDADGTVSPAEGRQRAAAECAALGAGVTVSVDGSPLTWISRAAELTLPPGEAGLHTTRIECRLGAPAALADPASVEITDRYLDDRIGWREITAVGEGVRLAESTVPAGTVSHELRDYPRMAATLTTAGLLLVGLRDRLDRVRVSDRLRRRTARLATTTPVLTAVLVLVVGLGLAARSLPVA